MRRTPYFRHVWCALAILFGSTSFGPAYAYDAAIEMQQSIGVVRAVIQGIRIQIVQKGSAELKAIDAQVSFAVDDSPLPSAYENDGVIHISNSLHVLLLYMEDVAYENLAHPVFQKCGQAYNDYLQAVLGENRTRYINAQPLLEIRTPEAFIALAQPLCKGYEKVFPLPASATDARNGRVYDMLGIVYFHELGHFALHHAGLSAQTLRSMLGGSADPKVLNELGRSRDQEFQADAWGLREFIATFGMNPNLAFYDLQHLLLITGNGVDCSNNASSTHPDGLERYVALSPQIRDYFNERMVGDVRQVMNALLNDTIAISSKAKTLLHCGKFAIPAMTDAHDYGNCYAEHRCFGGPYAIRPVPAKK